MPPYSNTETQTEEIVENWDYQIPIHKDNSLYKLLKVVESENRRIDVDIDDLYENRFVNSATGKELEKLGDLVGVNRKSGESDEKLRKRITGAFAAKASDTTYETFAEICISLLEAGSDSFELITPTESNPKTVEIRLDGAVLDNSTLTRDEIAVLLQNALSIDAQITMTDTGTFAFDGDDASLEGFDEGTWSTTIS